MASLLLTYLSARISELRHELARSDARDRGAYTVEAVVVMALLAVLAIGMLGVIATKVMAKANSIDLDGTG